MRLILIASLFWCNTALALYSECGEKATAQGYCESSNKVVWCEKQVKHSLVCEKGTLCAWNEVLKAFDCVSVSDECVFDGQQIQLTGTCHEGNSIVRWCDEGKVKSLACALGTVCGWNDSIGMMDCVKNDCLEAPLNGMCVNDNRAVRWCGDGKLLEKQCAEHERCDFDEKTNRWDCQSRESTTPPPPDTDANDGDDISFTPPGNNDLGPPEDNGGNKTSNPGCTSVPRPISKTAVFLLIFAAIALCYRRPKNAGKDVEA